MNEIQQLFNPEFLNRLDEIVVFKKLTKSDMMKIVDIVLEDVFSRLDDREIEITLTDGAREFLVNKGFDPVHGARPLKRTIQKYLEDPLAEELLKGKFQDGSQIQARKKGDHLEFVEIGRKYIDANKKADQAEEV